MKEGNYYLLPRNRTRTASGVYAEKRNLPDLKSLHVNRDKDVVGSGLQGRQSSIYVQERRERTLSKKSLNSQQNSKEISRLFDSTPLYVPNKVNQCKQSVSEDGNEKTRQEKVEQCINLKSGKEMVLKSKAVKLNTNNASSIEDEPEKEFEPKVYTSNSRIPNMRIQAGIMINTEEVREGDYNSSR